MVTTRRKFELIIRSRAAEFPLLIFRASSISSCGVTRGIRPISRRYLLNPVSLLFMSKTYPLEGKCRHGAGAGFFYAATGVIRTPSFEAEWSRGENQLACH